jgi:hypothetical protein
MVLTIGSVIIIIILFQIKNQLSRSKKHKNKFKKSSYEFELIKQKNNLRFKNKFKNTNHPYLSKKEFLALTNAEKYQLTLDRYKNCLKSSTEIGQMYERYIGKIYEEKGYEVTFEGIHKGFNDRGRDLIVKKDEEILIIQAKYWAEYKQITAEYIRKLYKTTELYKENINNEKKIIPVFYTTANYSSAAILSAEELNIELVYLKYDRNYPSIKCNINSSGEKIYHLPFDRYYDKVKIEIHKNEFYASTINEAESAGFRRAKSIWWQDLNSNNVLKKNK